MQKIFRFIVLLIFMILLVSCDVFLSPREGRWNLLDPDNELEWVDVVLPVEVDGYVDANDIGYFDSPFLVSDWMNFPETTTLIRFDYSNLPEYVDSAILQLYTTPASALGNLEVYVIGQSWTPDTIRWAPIYDKSIVDEDCPFSPVMGPVDFIGEYNGFDVSELVRYMQEHKDTYGFLLESNSGHVEFDSSRGANGPRLQVTGWDIPD